MGMHARVHHWLVSAWGDWHIAGASPAAALGQPDVEGIRDAMRMAVASCSNEHRARAGGQIARADTVIELWLLRSCIYQYLAQDLGESAARQRVGDLLPLFKDAVPGARPAASGSRASGGNLGAA